MEVLMEHTRYKDPSQNGFKVHAIKLQNKNNTNGRVTVQSYDLPLEHIN
jgi:hypothetical protein